MTRVRFLSQQTVVTGSDHLALVVDVRLTHRRLGRRRVAHLRLCTVNAGGRFNERHLRRLVQVYNPDVIAVQEGSDQRWLVAVLAEYGYALLVGEPSNQPGQAATPTFVGSRVTIRRDGTWTRLLSAQPIGPGAGPDYSKQKWWLRTHLAIDGIRFGASSWHATASQQFKGRMAAALTETRIWVGIATNLARPMFTLGDTNSDYQQPLTRWILRHGITSNHEQLGEVATHGRRSIDAVCVQRALVRTNGPTPNKRAAQ